MSYMDPITVTGLIVVAIIVVGGIVFFQIRSATEKKLLGALEYAKNDLKQYNFDALNELCDSAQTKQFDYEGSEYIRTLNYNVSEEADRKDPNNTFLVLRVTIGVSTKDKKHSEVAHMNKRKATKGLK